MNFLVVCRQQIQYVSVRGLSSVVLMAAEISQLLAPVDMKINGGSLPDSFTL